MRGETRQVLDECKRSGISPMYALDNLLPVLYESRPASALIHDTGKDRSYDDMLHEAAASRIHLALEGMMKKYGIKVGCGASCHVNGRALLSKIYMFRDGEDRLLEINELFKKAYHDMSFGRPSESYGKATRLDGKFLGYPKCCVEQDAEEDVKFMNTLAHEGLLGVGKFVPEHKMRVMSQGNRRVKGHMLEILGDGHDLGSAMEKLSRTPVKKKLPFFSHAFYPCKPNCSKARENGRWLATDYLNDDTILSEIYHKVMLPVNMIFISYVSGANRRLPNPQSLYEFANACIYTLLRENDSKALDTTSFHNVIERVAREFALAFY